MLSSLLNRACVAQWNGALIVRSLLVAPALLLIYCIRLRASLMPETIRTLMLVKQHLRVARGATQDISGD